MTQSHNFTVGVLAIQGAFSEHLQLLRAASAALNDHHGTPIHWKLLEVRKVEELVQCDALVIPGGESTTISLVAERSGLLEPLRDFVKVSRKPVWGTCAGLILLSESANRTKKGGQELIGGLDVRVNRNHFGRQTESFGADVDLPFLSTESQSAKSAPFHSIFIRAPVVEKVLPHMDGVQTQEASQEGTIVAPSKKPADAAAAKALTAEVEILARLPGRARALEDAGLVSSEFGHEGDIIAVRQGNCFGTSFHPELTNDWRIHSWWLGQVVEAVTARRAIG